MDLRVLRVFRLFRLLKLVRYSPALQTLGRVIADEYRALLGALLVIMVLLLFAATAMYFLEREAQPDKFGSIPGGGLVGARDPHHRRLRRRRADHAAGARCWAAW